CPASSAGQSEPSCLTQSEGIINLSIVDYKTRLLQTAHLPIHVCATARSIPNEDNSRISILCHLSISDISSSLSVCIPISGELCHWDLILISTLSPKHIRSASHAAHNSSDVEATLIHCLLDEWIHAERHVAASCDDDFHAGRILPSA